jgi:metal-dependent amidase/aminoacylase/carboxypeptidase family protein
MLRSMDESYFHEIQDRFREIVQGCALATGTQSEARFSGGSSTMKQNDVLRRRFSGNLVAYGLEDGPLDLDHLGSSDMGNVSQLLPTIHPYLAIAPLDTPGHSTAFRDAAATEAADDATLLAATLVAQTAYDLFADPSLVEAAWAEFQETS